MKSFALIPLYLSFFLFSNNLIASHIVGGEILITHIQNFTYEIRMNIYRDAVGVPLSGTAFVDVFKRGTGVGTPVLVGTFILPRLYDSIVPPQTPGCQGSVITIERHYYADTITLSPTVYTDQSGYLFRWQSCCRNANISNGGANQSASIVTLFSPVVDASGVQFINSTPQLSPTISEYGCVSQLFHVNFGGIDPDGDSLSYVMYNPFLSNAPFPGIVQPLTTPYSNPVTQFGQITWNPTYYADDAIHGNTGPPDPAVDRLKVNPLTGQLTVTPRIPGNYLFGVWCREFRDTNGDGIKEMIGSVFRDYQLPVVANCPIPDILDGPIVTDSMNNIIGVPGDTLHVPGLLAQRGIKFRVWDSDFDTLDPVGQNAIFSIKAFNFKDSLVDINPKQYNFTSKFDTAILTVDFHKCAASGSIPLEVKLITSKGHCPLPYFDSTSWFFDVDSIPNCDTLGLRISGQVTKNGLVDLGIQGYVLLLKPDSSGQINAWSLAGVSYLDSSYYQFANVDPGIYYVQAFLDPQDQDFLSFLPTYHIDQVGWATANPISVQSSQPGKNVDLIAINGPTGGPGLIYGTVVEGGNKSSGPGDPVRDVQVQLWDALGNKLAMKLTDAIGKFSFSLIGLGNYQLKVEYPGLPHTQEPVILTAVNPIQGFLFTVNSTEVITAIPREDLLEEIVVFPNPVPANDKLMISGPPIGFSQVLIRDSRGVTIGKRNLNFQESDIVELNLAKLGLSPGVYFMSFVNDKKIHSIRLVIIDD